MLCLNALEARGFTGLTRDIVKDPYMGVFYGQGRKSFATLANYAAEGEEPKKGEHAHSLLGTMLSIGDDLEANAGIFHSIVEKSFGVQLLGLRNHIKEVHAHYEGEKGASVQVFHTERPTEYYLPDGQQVATKYYMQEDIKGVVVGAKEPTDDVRVTVGMTHFRFNGMKFPTAEYDMGCYARTGFVNFIQSVDGLLARLIVSKLEDLGALICDPVHDCFRVSVPDMIDGKLHNAIKFAYNSLFCYEEDHKTLELPFGTDAMKMYFEGVNRASKDEYKRTAKQVTKSGSQFTFSPVDKKWSRKLHRTNMDVAGLINDLKNDLDEEGNTYYFAK
jgi:hypothetical protein